MNANNLLDLVHIFFADPDVPLSRKSMTKTVCRYAVLSMGVESMAELPINKIRNASKTLRKYLEKSQLGSKQRVLSSNTRRNYISFFNRFIAWCEKQSLLPPEIGSELFPEWIDATIPLKGVTPGRKGHRDGLRKLAFWATAFGLKPIDLTTAHLKSYIEYLEKDSQVEAWRQLFHRAEKEWNHQVEQGVLPALHWPDLPSAARSKYSLRVHEWPVEMQAEYNSYRTWCLAEYIRERPPQYSQREVSADQNLSNLERIAGYTHRIRGVPLDQLTIDIFFDETIITDYINWLIQERLGGKRTVTLERLCAQLLSMARQYFYRPEAEEWLIKLKKYVSNAPVRDKKERLFSMDELEKIADGIQARRIREKKNAIKKGLIPNRMRQAQHVRRELLFRLIIQRPLRQKNIREIKIGKNLYKNIKGIYVLSFEGSEMKNGRPYKISFPKNLVTLLEKYLNDYRRILCNGHDNEYLFPSPNGGHICDRTVQSIIGRPAKQILRRSLNPHLIRDCIAYWWLQQNPGDYLFLSKLLGHEDVRTTIKCYSNIDAEDAAKKIDEMRKKNKRSRKKKSGE
ncbi:MAG: site-specific integrase [Fidelibacterota bacterium]|nr:MAG: site-specific integrase [Candidatus Neomarinimicrobiota bacterium]